MSKTAKDSAAHAEDLISSGQETLDSSTSLSPGESSVRLGEQLRSGRQESGLENREKMEEEKWWLKRPETRLEVATGNSVKAAYSSGVGTSTKEFLEREKFCNVNKFPSISQGDEKRDKDDTLCEILASAAFDKYPSDFENATDEDIGSFLEEISKIAGALSPSSAPERTKSSEASRKNPREEEKSVQELLEEAEKLVRENSLSRSGSRSDTLVPADPMNFDENGRPSGRPEEDIFHLIEQEVHRESEKIRKSPKNEMKQQQQQQRRETSPSFEIVYENVNSLGVPKLAGLEAQKKRFDEHKVQVSSSSDLDDPIDRHSKSEDAKKVDETQKDKENLQKEITDVDKDFFDDLLRRSKAKIEGGMSGSSSFGQEDFSHFLRILQGQERKEQEAKGGKAVASNTMRKEILLLPEGNIAFPEKEITAILEQEMPAKKRNMSKTEKDDNEFGGSDSNAESVVQHGGKKSSEDRSRIHEDSKMLERQASKTEDGKKVVNSKNELYTVGLTPRLELFADAIPKLIAEKTNEKVVESNANDQVVKSDENDEKKERREASVEVSPTGPVREKNEETVDKSSESRGTREKAVSGKLGPSKSYDRLAKPVANRLRSSLDDVRASGKSGKTSISSWKATAKQSVKVACPSKQTPKMKCQLKSWSSKSNLPAKYSVRSEIPNGYSPGGGDCRRDFTKVDFETLYREEKRKNVLLKEQIDSEAKLYKQQMQRMRASFEEELFGLKKANVILTGKIEQFESKERRVGIPGKVTTTTKSETRIRLLETELEKQEAMINAYETENKRLIEEMRCIREDRKNMENKEKTNLKEINNEQRVNETMKDLQEETLKLNLEIKSLREKNSEAALKIEDAMQQESLLKEELEMFKDQLKTKNDFINARLQSMTAAEHESRKKTEDLKIELGSKTEQLKSMRIEYEKLEQAILPLEKELLELRVKDGSMTEKLEIAKSHVEREKQLTLKLKDQVILDNKKILDLNRQVREMERILKRKNPDSVSALILAAKSDNERINLEKVKLLEDRVASLEGEIRAKEEIGEERLTDLQKKFAEMKEKYVMQVMELEEKLIEATAREHKNYNDMFTQTAAKSLENKAVEAGTLRERSVSVQIERDDRRDQKDQKDQKAWPKAGPKSLNAKEDAHLIATIRGLKLEIVNKDKSFAKMSKEFQELQKTNRRLQKEREKLLYDRRNFKEVEKNGRPASACSDPRIYRTKNTEVNDQNSNLYQNGHLSNRLSGSVPRLYDPLRYSENGENLTVKKLTNENEILKEELNKINKDFMTLKNKRLYDLNLLQEEHEREMAALLKEYSVKFGDSKLVKLQGQINTQVAIITHLKQQIEKLRDYKEQVIVLKVEREHLENKVKILNEKVKYLSTPGNEQLQLLQDKITILQQRHESREMTLQNLVRDLLRNRTQCRDCKGEKGKSTKQLCYFRQELDNILGMLQDISNL